LKYELTRKVLQMKFKMKFIGLVIFGSLLFTWVWAAPPPDYALTYAYKEMNRETLTMTLKYYLHNGLKLRIDYLSAGGAVRMSKIFLKDKGLVWTLYSFSQQYQEQPLDQDVWDIVTGGFAFEWDWDQCQKTGETKLLNYPCDIYQMQKNATITTAYIAQGMNIVLKAESRENDKIVLKMEATDFRPEKTAASFFEIPAGYTKSQ
jgi:hypothetical protein